MESRARKLLRRAIPVEVRSYITRGGPTGIDRTTWDEEYATGQWAKLGAPTEMPRFALIAGFSRRFDAAANILDVGCGEGHLSAWLCQDAERRYLGIDLSSVAIEQARERAPRGARFEAADAASFNPSEQFDIILLNEMLYYMDHPEQIVERYGRFLAPGGALIISMFRVPESLRAWRRCASRLEVLDQVLVRGSKGTEWNIWLCKPIQHGTVN
jgi:2-polyprenyl-6-hydroxyphenyl methylase/3-demethylubiquinone-9 3-methyltransferase